MHNAVGVEEGEGLKEGEGEAGDVGGRAGAREDVGLEVGETEFAQKIDRV